MDCIVTIIILLFLHLYLFVLILDKLKTGPRPTLILGEPLLNSHLYKVASCLVPESDHLIEVQLYKKISLCTVFELKLSP